jgi:hypothetical protein
VTSNDATRRRHETFADWWRLCATRDQLPLVAICCPTDGSAFPMLICSASTIDDAQVPHILREAARRIEERLGAR